MEDSIFLDTVITDFSCAKGPRIAVGGVILYAVTPVCLTGTFVTVGTEVCISDSLDGILAAPDGIKGKSCSNVLSSETEVT